MQHPEHKHFPVMIYMQFNFRIEQTVLLLAELHTFTLSRTSCREIPRDWSAFSLTTVVGIPVDIWAHLHQPMSRIKLYQCRIGIVNTLGAEGVLPRSISYLHTDSIDFHRYNAYVLGDGVWGISAFTGNPVESSKYVLPCNCFFGGEGVFCTFVVLWHCTGYSQLFPYEVLFVTVVLILSYFRLHGP